MWSLSISRSNISKLYPLEMEFIQSIVPVYGRVRMFLLYLVIKSCNTAKEICNGHDFLGSSLVNIFTKVEEIH